MAIFTNLTRLICFAIYETIFAKTETRSVSKVLSGFNKRTSKNRDQGRLVYQAAGEVHKLAKRGQCFPIWSEQASSINFLHNNFFNLFSDKWMRLCHLLLGKQARENLAVVCIHASLLWTFLSLKLSLKSNSCESSLKL